MDWFDLSQAEQEEYMAWAENLMNDPDPLSSQDLSHLSADEQRAFLGLLEYNDDSLSDTQLGRIARYLFWTDQRSAGLQESYMYNDDIPEEYYDAAANMIWDFGDGIDEEFRHHSESIPEALEYIANKDEDSLAMLLWDLKILESNSSMGTMRENKMKFTKNQLRRIIKETVWGIDGTPEDWDRDEWTGASGMAAQEPAPAPQAGAQAAVEWCFSSGMDWRQCAESLMSAGWPEEELMIIEQEFDDMVSMEENMLGSQSQMYTFENKLTKRQLKQIIREEKQSLNEEYEASKETYGVCNDMIIELITELADMFSDGELGDGAYDAMMAKDKTAHAILTQAAIAARQK